MVELMIIYLGSVVDGFTFHKLKKISPARFLQRGIMYIIMRLLCDHYEIFSKEEDTEIKRMSEFSALYYGIWFLTCPLTASAPYNDLNAIKEMRDLKDLRQVEADACLDSWERHLDYLSPALVIFSLANSDVSASEKKALPDALLAVLNLRDSIIFPFFT